MSKTDDFLFPIDASMAKELTEFNVNEQFKKQLRPMILKAITQGNKRIAVNKTVLYRNINMVDMLIKQGYKLLDNDMYDTTYIIWE